MLKYVSNCKENMYLNGRDAVQEFWSEKKKVQYILRGRRKGMEIHYVQLIILIGSCSITYSQRIFFIENRLWNKSVV